MPPFSLLSLLHMHAYDGFASARSTSSTRSSCLVLLLNLRSSPGPGSAGHSDSVVAFGERRKRSCDVSFIAVYSRERFECRTLFKTVSQKVTGRFQRQLHWLPKFFCHTFLLGSFLSGDKGVDRLVETPCFVKHRSEHNSACRKEHTTILNTELLST